jgi:hypothetical protein
MIKKLGDYFFFLIIVVLCFPGIHSFSAIAAKELMLEDFEIPPEKLFRLWLKGTTPTSKLE